MRFYSKIKAFVACLAMGYFALGCDIQEDPMQAAGADAPEIAAMSPLAYCGNFGSGNLVDGAGAIGSGNIFGANTYGTFSLANDQTDVFFEALAGSGWFFKSFAAYMGPVSSVPMASGAVDYNAFPLQQSINPPLPAIYTNLWPLTSGMYCAADAKVVARLELVDLDFLGRPQATAVVWLEGAALDNLGARAFDFCAEPCGSTVDTQTAGSCDRCDSENTVTFYNCDSVAISSCKNIGNVVVAYEDCSTVRYNNINSTNTSIVSSPGRIITSVWVKSGCNASGDGPGFGRRFDNHNSCTEGVSCAVVTHP